MNIVKSISVIGLVLMTAGIIYAVGFGDFAEEGAWIISHPWGIVSLVDLYVGFTLFSAWIVYREGLTVKTGVWVALMMVFGNWTAALYVLLALNASRGNWNHFWMGHRAG